MSERSHVPVVIRRLKGANPGDMLFCELCGVRWPCLAASEAAIARAREARERGVFVSSSNERWESDASYHRQSRPGDFP